MSPERQNSWNDRTTRYARISSQDKIVYEPNDKFPLESIEPAASSNPRYSPLYPQETPYIGLEAIPDQQIGPRKDIQKTLPQKPQSYKTGWRLVVAISCLASASILLINLVVLGWAHKQSKSTSNNYILYAGDCTRVKNIDTYSHLALNLLAMLLLGSGNFAMQVLSSPVRENVDIAHTELRYLDIGISSFRNLWVIGHKKRSTWVFLALTSLLAHLFWNASLVATGQAVNSRAAIVSQDFLHGAVTNGTSLSNRAAPSDHWSLLQGGSSNASLTQLDNQQCIDSLQQAFIPDVANYILVSNISTGSNGSVLSTAQHDSTINQLDNDWWCSPNSTYGSCTKAYSGAIITPDNWTLYIDSDEDSGNVATIRIQYCLVDSVQPACTMQLVPYFHYILVFLNILHFVSLITLLLMQLDPMLTLGDAIASFLDNADTTTTGVGPISARIAVQSLHEGLLQTLLAAASRLNKRRRIYFQSASRRRLILTSIM